LPPDRLRAAAAVENPAGRGEPEPTQPVAGALNTNWGPGTGNNLFSVPSSCSHSPDTCRGSTRRRGVHPLRDCAGAGGTLVVCE